MRSIPLVVAAVAWLTSCTAEAPAPPRSEGGAGWTTLFDGTSLDGWTPIGTADWRLADGVVEAAGGTGFLVSKESYDNFDLRVEFWVSPDANSGVFIRCQDPEQVTAANSYEVNIYDTRPDPQYRTGSIVNIAPPMEQIDAGGRWNTFEITADGPRLTVRLNGTTTVNTEDSQFARGPIALQSGVGTVRFRNVQIRRL